jgi:hypothetical protein
MGATENALDIITWIKYTISICCIRKGPLCVDQYNCFRVFVQIGIRGDEIKIKLISYSNDEGCVRLACIHPHKAHGA